MVETVVVKVLTGAVVVVGGPGGGGPGGLVSAGGGTVGLVSTGGGGGPGGLVSAGGGTVGLVSTGGGGGPGGLVSAGGGTVGLVSTGGGGPGGLVSAGGGTVGLVSTGGGGGPGGLVSAGGGTVGLVSTGGGTVGLVVTGGGSVGAVGAAEVVVTGLVTVLGGLQSNEMVGTTMLQAGLGLLGWGGKTIVTLRAPPPGIPPLAHCFKDKPSFGNHELTLRVHNSGSRLLAGVAVLAGRAIRHVVVELEIAVELGLDMDRTKGEVGNLGPASERGRRLLGRATQTANELLAGTALEASTTKVAAGEALEVEVTVAAEWARGKVLEGEAGLLHIVALVVGVVRNGKRRYVAEALHWCKSWNYDGRGYGTHRCRNTGSQGRERDDALHVQDFLSVEQIQEMETTDVGGEKRVERTRRSERWIGETKVGSKEANGLDPEKMLSRCRRERKYREEMLMKTREDGRERV